MLKTDNENHFKKKFEKDNLWKILQQSETKRSAKNLTIITPNTSLYCVSTLNNGKV